MGFEILIKGIRKKAYAKFPFFHTILFESNVFILNIKQIFNTISNRQVVSLLKKFWSTLILQGNPLVFYLKEKNVSEFRSASLMNGKLIFLFTNVIYCRTIIECLLFFYPIKYCK